jgi:hypothetical protein
MRHFISISGVLVLTNTLLAASLPVITTQPQNQVVSPGVTATLSVAASDATSFQWRFNGADISGATNSTLQVPNAQTNNSGYYMVVAKNATCWAPSQMGYLSVVGSSGRVPFSNYTNTTAQARYQWNFALDFSLYGTPITNGTAQVIAGPALDRMQAVSSSISVNNGYFKQFFNVSVSTVAPGQTVYYRVDVTYPYGGGSYTQPSRVLKLVAGEDGYPVPSTADLVFPYYLEWPTPSPSYSGFSPTNQIRVLGETFSFTNWYWCYSDYGTPAIQWRKDGKSIPDATNFVKDSHDAVTYTGVLTITNAQAADAGIYDAVVLGDFSLVSPKISLSIQLTNGQGIFLAPRINGTNFVSDLQGVAGRNYAIQWSSNLTVWNDLWTLSNLTGTITFTNFPATIGTRFYRSILLP